jgi:Ca2+-binding EF-hand superfamily protein
MSTISGVSNSSDAWASMKAQRSQMQAKMFSKVDTDSSGGVDKTELQSLIDDVAKKSGVSNSSSTDELFSKMDADSDGSLSVDELGKGMKEILPPPSTLDFAQSRSDSTSGQDDLFSKIDTDGNGAVSQDELQSLMDKMTANNGATSETAADSSDLFAKLDTDGDGSLTAAEFEAGRPQGDSATQGSQGPHGAGGPPPPAGGAGGADSASSTYDPLDTNQDGTVSAAERLAGNTSTDAVQTLLKAIDTDGDSQISATESDAFMTQLTAQLESLSTSTSTSTQSTSTSATAANDQLDLVKLVQQAYEQIASGLTQQSQGSTLSTLA